jgi:hypothetical protein
MKFELKGEQTRIGPDQQIDFSASGRPPEKRFDTGSNGAQRLQDLFGQKRFPTVTPGGVIREVLCGLDSQKVMEKPRIAKHEPRPFGKAFAYINGIGKDAPDEKRLLKYVDIPVDGLVIHPQRVTDLRGVPQPGFAGAPESLRPETPPVCPSVLLYRLA